MQFQLACAGTGRNGIAAAQVRLVAIPITVMDQKRSSPLLSRAFQLACNSAASRTRTVMEKVMLYFSAVHGRRRWRAAVLGGMIAALPRSFLAELRVDQRQHGLHGRV